MSQRYTSMRSFNTQGTASAIKARKTSSGGRNKYLNSGMFFRLFTIILVFVTTFCLFTVANKEINDRISADKYDEITGGQGDVDDPTKDDYTTGPVPWISLLDTLDPDGFDPLSLPLTGVDVGQRPDDILDPTDLEAQLGYVNRQQKIWELHNGINSDISAWIYVPGLGINLPVAVDTKQDDFYLNHLYDKSFSYSGTLFMNPTSSINPIARNLIIHGHNMKNGTMFGNLQNYITGTKAFYDSHRYIFLDTLYGSYRYEIFSVYVTEATSGDYLKTGFKDTQEFLDTCEGFKESGKYSTDITFQPEDRILTLSTCYAPNNNKRVVVHARLAYPDPNEVLASPSPSVSPTATPTPTPTPTPSSNIYVVMLKDKTSSLNLRQEANATSTVLGRLSYGDKLTLLEETGEWAKVRTVGGTEGYVMRSYLIPESEFSWVIPTLRPTTAPTPTPAP